MNGGENNMRYIIIFKDNKPFFTNWFDAENHFSTETIMVIDLNLGVYTVDGEHWEEIEEDHL